MTRMDREPHSSSNHANDMIVIGRRLHARDFIKLLRLLLGSGVVMSSSRNQAGDEGAEQGFAAMISL